MFWLMFIRWKREQYRQDKRAALISTMVAEPHRNTKVKSDPYDIEFFLPHLEDEDTRMRPTFKPPVGNTKAMVAKAEIFAKVTNTKFVKGGKS
jgi:hypothetical protein